MTSYKFGDVLAYDKEAYPEWRVMVISCWQHNDDTETIGFVTVHEEPKLGAYPVGEIMPRYVGLEYWHLADD